jgi:hypothetical protein
MQPLSKVCERKGFVAKFINAMQKCIVIPDDLSMHITNVKSIAESMMHEDVFFSMLPNCFMRVLPNWTCECYQIVVLSVKCCQFRHMNGVKFCSYQCQLTDVSFLPMFINILVMLIS